KSPPEPNDLDSDDDDDDDLVVPPEKNDEKEVWSEELRAQRSPPSPNVEQKYVPFISPSQCSSTHSNVKSSNSLKPLQIGRRYRLQPMHIEDVSDKKRVIFYSAYRGRFLLA